MKPDNGRNLSKVPYFSLEEYVSKIKLEDRVLIHLEETSQEFDKYFKLLGKQDDYAILIYWLDSLLKEFKFSNQIENHYNPKNLLFTDDIFFDNFNISHQRIKRIHDYVSGTGEVEDYRNTEVRVSSYNFGYEDIFWYGANSEDVKKFMDDFIKIYKNSNLSVLHTSPFLKSALIHLLFVRIHPFSDGNGRTARMIQNIRFTGLINSVYKTDIRICPLNLSQSILMNKSTYIKKINNIYFDLTHDSNREINDWFEFMLNMVDEQLHYNMKRLPELEKAFKFIANNKPLGEDIYEEYAKRMKIK